LIFITALVLIPFVVSLDNGLGRRPAMGFSTWNYFFFEINETLVKSIADSMVTTGLRDVGYEYINIDAGYLIKQRSADGSLQTNSNLFPNGMKAIADYLHAKGLKLGVYTDIGQGECGPGPGSGGHYQQDAQTFASWGVDYLKVDYCGKIDITPSKSQYDYWAELRDALNSTRRPIYYSICPKTIAPDVGTAVPYAGHLVYSPPLNWTVQQHHALSNSWLVEYVNIVDNWYSPTETDCINAGGAPCGMITNVDAFIAMTSNTYSAPGGWNDADMLQVCNYGYHNGGMTLTEYQSEYSLWAIFASPMIISADLRTIATDHPDCLAMLKNQEVIAVNQDLLGRAGSLVYQDGDNTTVSITQQVWIKPLQDSSVAGLMLNRGPTASSMSINFTWLPPGTSAQVRDLWLHKDMGTFTSFYETTVQSHAVVMIIIKRV